MLEADIIDSEIQTDDTQDDYDLEPVDGEIDLKEVRKQQWRELIEAELQTLIIEAAKLRKCITDAKTTTKKEFYGKRFKKVSNQIRQYVGALQRLGSPIFAEAEETDNGTASTTDE